MAFASASAALSQFVGLREAMRLRVIGAGRWVSASLSEKDAFGDAMARRMEESETDELRQRS